MKVLKVQKELTRQRLKLLSRVETTLEGPMMLLGFIWLILLIIDLIKGLSSSLQFFSTIIWIIFILDFIAKFTLAPVKLTFLKKNWLTLISLIIPAFRLFKIVRFIRLLRTLKGLRLVRMLSSINRRMRSLNATMSRRGFGYVSLLTVGIIFVGAAGIYAFEKEANGFQSYWDALWWTMMLVITVGTEYWPRTGEGRALCFILALYGFAVLGYITATLASFFIGRDAEEKDAPVAGSKDIELLRKEIRELSKVIQELRVNK
jgi:voltage-gated potassium channel